jgi:hypothetical protein
MKRRLELYSAIAGTLLFAALFVCSYIATEFNTRDRVFFALMIAGFGVGWYRTAHSS